MPCISRLGMLAASVALLAGCGHTTQLGSSRTLELAVTEYHLTPASARVSAGTVTIVVRNVGVLTHNLTVSAGGQTIYSTKPIFPGQSAQVTFSLGPGKYALASTLLDDQALGVYGTLTVTG